MALAMAGVTAETPDPDDGRFYRDDNGVLTGLVAEKARDVFRDLIQAIPIERSVETGLN